MRVSGEKILQYADLSNLKIKAGLIRVNIPGTEGSMAPFGGYKQSGIGRERSIYGLKNT